MAAVRVPRFSSTTWLAVGLLCAGTAAAAERFGPIDPPSQQFMLYVSRSLGGTGRPTHSYGLKYEHTSSAAIDASTRFAAPLRHRTLVDLQFSHRQGARLQLGPRTTWDLGLRHLGPTAQLVDSPWRPGAMGSIIKPELQLP
jgi:hypothetical protein